MLGMTAFVNFVLFGLRIELGMEDELFRLRKVDYVSNSRAAANRLELTGLLVVSFSL